MTLRSHWTKLVAVLALCCAAAQAQRIAVSTRVVISGQTRPVRQLASSRRISLSISLPIRHQDELKSLLQQLRDPSSANYGKYLAPGQFADNFGPAAEDYQKVVAYLTAQGMTVTRTSRSRTLISVTATAQQISDTFHVTLNEYQKEAEDYADNPSTQTQTFFAPDRQPTVEAGIPILSVNGLSDRHPPHSMLRHASASDALRTETTGSGPGGQFLGKDMRTAYAPNISLAGEGQVVALPELGPYNMSDVQSYFTRTSQAFNVPIYNVLINVDGVCTGVPRTHGCDDGEQVADIEQAIPMAPSLAALVVYETYGTQGDALALFTQIADDDAAKQISFSWGWFPDSPSNEPGFEQVFMQFQAQGQNFFASSGDSGADLTYTLYPQDSPNVIVVGGTDLTTNGDGSWRSEVAWAGSTGGWSTPTPIPDYQLSVVNSANQGSAEYRNVPDVAMEANTDNYYCANGTCQGGLGGTSLSAPRWAGYMALINQQANGFAVPALIPAVYTLGRQSNYNSLFHDITEGTNFNTTSPDMFTAVPGYDLTTGWGSPTGQALFDTLAPSPTSLPNFSLNAALDELDIAEGSESSDTLALSPVNGFNGAVAFSAVVVGGPEDVTATLDHALLNGSGTNALHVSVASSMPVGNYLVVVTGTSGKISHEAYVKLVVSAASAILPAQAVLSPASLSFGSQATGTTSSAQAVTLSNPGGADLTVSSIHIGGANPGNFVETTTCGSTLAAGASCDISVTFAPTSVATYSATLSIQDNAATPTAAIALSGTGVAPAGDFALSSPTSPQTVTGGSTAQYTITITPTPSGDAFTNAVTLSATGLPAGATAVFSPASVTPGSSPVSVTLTIQTAASAHLNPETLRWPALPASLALVFGGTLGLLRRRKESAWSRILSLLLLAGALCLGLQGTIGCGVSGSPAQAQSPAPPQSPPSSQPATYTITVTGISGSDQHTTTVKLTVS